MSSDELRGKFLSCAAFAAHPSNGPRLDEVANAIAHLENKSDAETLIV
jgi:hypothetical protein